MPWEQWILGFIGPKQIMVSQYQPRAIIFIFTLHNRISLNSHCLIGHTLPLINLMSQIPTTPHSPPTFPRYFTPPIPLLHLDPLVPSFSRVALTFPTQPTPTSPPTLLSFLLTFFIALTLQLALENTNF